MFSFLTLGFFQTAFFIFFSLCLTFAVRSDRGRDNFSKWAVTISGITIFAVVLVMTGNFNVDPFLTQDFWINVLKYLGVGLMYAVLIELPVRIRRASKEVKEAWKIFLDEELYFQGAAQNPEQITMLQGITRVNDGSIDVEHLRRIKLKVSNFALANISDLVYLKVLDDGVSISPSLKRESLSNDLFNWTIFFPAFAASLVFGDILMSVFNTISNLASSLIDRMLKFAFSDSLKV